MTFSSITRRGQWHGSWQSAGTWSNPANVVNPAADTWASWSSTGGSAAVGTLDVVGWDWIPQLTGQQVVGVRVAVRHYFSAPARFNRCQVWVKNAAGQDISTPVNLAPLPSAATVQQVALLQVPAAALLVPAAAPRQDVAGVQIHLEAWGTGATGTTVTWFVDSVEVTIEYVAPLPAASPMPPLPNAPWRMFGGWNEPGGWQALESAVGRPVNFELWFYGWAAGNTQFQTSRAQAAVNRGCIPLASWEPWDYRNGMAQTGGMDNVLGQILLGNHDAYIRAEAQRMRSVSGEVWLRFAHEMNGLWYPWAVWRQGPNPPGAYIDAWRRIVNIFRDEGATNVRHCWCPNTTWDIVNTQYPMGQLYPGDAFVDCLGLDGYNWADMLAGGSWQTPSQVFDWSYRQLTQGADGGISSTKPLIIPETGTVGTTSQRVGWLQALGPYIDSTSFAGLGWFNENKLSTEGVNWRLDVAPDVTAQARVTFNNPPFAQTAPPLAITTSTLGSVTVGQPFSLTLQASGGTPPYAWQVAGLPAGLAASGATIAGTTGLAGTYQVGVSVTDSMAVSASVTLPLTVIATPDLHMVTVSLPAGRVGEAYQATLQASGGTPPYAWEATLLPPGLSLTGAQVAGVPEQSGMFGVTVRLTDAAQGEVVAGLNLAIQPAPVVNPPLTPPTPETPRRSYDLIFNRRYLPPLPPEPPGPPAVYQPTLVPIRWDGLELQTREQDPDSQREFLAIVELVSGWYASPPLDGHDAARALADGAIWGPKILGPRQIEIQGAAVGPRRRLIAWRDLLAHRASDRHVAELVIGDPWLNVSRVATVRADTDTFHHEFFAGPAAFRYQVTLVAADPLLYDEQWQQVVLSTRTAAEAGRAYDPPPRWPRRYDHPPDWLGQLDPPVTVTSGWGYGEPYPAGSSAYMRNDGNADAPVYATYQGDFTDTRLTDNVASILLAGVPHEVTILVATATLVAEGIGGASRAQWIRPGSRPMTLPGFATSRWHLYGQGSGRLTLSWRSAWT